MHWSVDGVYLTGIIHALVSADCCNKFYPQCKYSLSVIVTTTTLITSMDQMPFSVMFSTVEVTALTTSMLLSPVSTTSYSCRYVGSSSSSYIYRTRLCDSKQPHNSASLVPRPPCLAFVTCSTKSGGRPGWIYHVMHADADVTFSLLTSGFVLSPSLFFP